MKHRRPIGLMGVASWLERVTRKTESRNRDDLANHYAWVLFRACSLSREVKLYERYAAAQRELSGAQEQALQVVIRTALRERRKVNAFSAARRKGANAKLAHDPVQQAKGEAFALWQERHAGKHPRLRTNEQFAIECMRRWPVLVSAATITRWCTKWSREAKTHAAS